MFFQQREEFDAIVVGSGISGGWAAKELTEKGLRTLVLERGRDLQHGKDYVTEHKEPWTFPLRNRRITPEVAGPEYQVQSRTGQFFEATKHMFVKDTKHPYVEAKPFTWIQGDHVGGRSLMWGRQVYRWSDLDFEANRRDGHGVDWPLRYRDLAPWYAHVERFVGIAGNHVALDPVRTDAWRVPLLRVHCSWGENERAIREDVKTQAAEMLEAVGCTDVQSYDNDGPPGFSVHEMGTARMGRDPRTSDLNAHNQAHDVPNLFVTGGACMTSSSCVNPSLTYMALTARAVDHAVEETTRRHL